MTWQSGGGGSSAPVFRGVIANLALTTIPAGSGAALIIDAPMKISSDVSVTPGSSIITIVTPGWYRLDAVAVNDSLTTEAVIYRLRDTSDDDNQTSFVDEDDGVAGRPVVLKATAYYLFNPAGINGGDVAVRVFNDGEIDIPFTGSLSLEYVGSDS